MFLFPHNVILCISIVLLTHKLYQYNKKVRIMSNISLTNQELALNLAQRTQLPVVSVMALKFAMTVARWSDRSKQRRELSRLSDQHLDDIGLDRTQAIAEANKRFWQQ